MIIIFFINSCVSAVQAVKYPEKVKYNESEAICQRINKTLPKTEFMVIKNENSLPSIFWIAENQKTQAEDKKLESRLELNVAILQLHKGFCAILGL